MKNRSFDTVRHLDNPQVIVWYIVDALRSGKISTVARALRNVLRATRMIRTDEL